jgi:hypothetical protein
MKVCRKSVLDHAWSNISQVFLLWIWEHELDSIRNSMSHCCDVSAGHPSRRKVVSPCQREREPAREARRRRVSVRWMGGSM